MSLDTLPLLVGFGLGFMHALDADHVMAVSTLANQKPSRRRTLWFSLHWALGHGGVLLCCGLILFGLGITIPEGFQHIAEMLVGVVLIVLGISFFWKFRQLNVQLRTHRHDNVEHTHWVVGEHGDDALKPSTTVINNTAANKTEIKKNHQYHQPVMIGMLHGLAGSAPLLALIPAVTSGELGIAISYLLIFSVGVALSMLAFGLGFAWMQNYLHQHYQRVFIVCRHVIALAAIGFGCFWVMQAV